MTPNRSEPTPAAAAAAPPAEGGEAAPTARRRIEERDGIVLQRLDPDQIDDATAAEMIALFTATFGRWPRLDPGVPLVEHLRWKIAGPSSPFGSIQARVDGRLAFATTSWASWFRIGGARRLRVITSDTATDPAFQGRGLYSLTVKHRPSLLPERYDLSLHERSSSRRTDRPLGRRGQTPLAAPMARRLRVLRPHRWRVARKRPSRALGAVALATLGSVLSRARRPALRRRGLEPFGTGDFDPRFEVLFEAAATDFDLVGERSVEFLRWRYGDRRAGPFRVRAISAGDRLLGYSVLRLAEGEGFLVELLALPGRADVVEALAADAVAVARGAGAAAIECWLGRRHPYAQPLRRQGFFDTGADIGVYWHPVGTPAGELTALADPAARVHFQLGDTDLV